MEPMRKQALLDKPFEDLTEEEQEEIAVEVMEERMAEDPEMLPAEALGEDE